MISLRVFKDILQQKLPLQTRIPRNMKPSDSSQRIIMRIDFHPWSNRKEEKLKQLKSTQLMIITLKIIRNTMHFLRTSLKIILSNQIISHNMLQLRQKPYNTLNTSQLLQNRLLMEHPTTQLLQSQLNIPHKSLKKQQKIRKILKKHLKIIKIT